MKRLINILVVCLCLIVTSCGLSDADKNTMEANAKKTTQEEMMFPLSKLTNFRSGKIAGTDATYIADFNEELNESGHTGKMAGFIGFDKSLNVASYAGSKIKAIVLNEIEMDGQTYPIEIIAKSLPNLLHKNPNTSSNAAQYVTYPQIEACQMIIKAGEDAYIDKEGYFVYVTSLHKLTDSPNHVAKTFYPTVSYIDGIKGVKIESAEEKGTQLGIYTKE